MKARGFDPTWRRPSGSRARGFAAGGMVRGPGTGTSDDVRATVPEGSYIMPADSTAALGSEALAELGQARGFPLAQRNPAPSAPSARGFHPGAKAVPVNLSNGEYQMPPEQVHAVGVQALNQIKGATHTPFTRGFPVRSKPAQQPDDQRLFFADGGVVDDELRADPEAVAASAPPQVAQGVYQHGRGQYSDSPTGMGFSPGFTGQPSAQAMSMMDAVAGRSMPGSPAARGFSPDSSASTPPSASGAPGTRGFQPAAQPQAPSAGAPSARGFPPAVQAQNNGIDSGAASAQRVADIYKSMAQQQTPQMQAPQVLHSGNDWQARNDLRSASISAGSMTNQPGYGGVVTRRGVVGGAPADNEARRTHANLLTADQAARGAQSGMHQEAMRQNGGLQREALQQQGANQRGMWQAIQDQQRLGLDQQRLGVEQRRADSSIAVQDVEMRGAQRQQQLLDRFIDPRSTPEQRAVSEQALRLFKGGGSRAGQPTQLPTSALKLQLEELDALGISSGIDADLGAINEQLSSGRLNLGPLRNLWNRGRNAFGSSTEESRNLATFDATLEKLRNDSLRLNKGVQTEGDAQRAWNEVLKSTSDPALVRQRLGEVQRINQRAAGLRGANVSQLRQNFGAEPLDTAQYRNVASAIGEQSPSYAPARSQAEWSQLPSGTLYTAPDGSLRRKK